MKKRKNTWSKALEAERIYRETHAEKLDGFPGLLAPYIKPVVPMTCAGISRKFRRKYR